MPLFNRVNSKPSSLASEASPTSTPSPPDPLFDLQFRLILLGDSGAGKSSLMRRFTNDCFAPSAYTEPTVGVDFFAKTIDVRCDAKSSRIKLQLWDTAGQERFRSITRSYYRHSVGVLLVYDPFQRASFAHLGQWMHEAQRHIEPRTAVYTVVAAKSDLADTQGIVADVNEDEGRQWAEARGADFFATSAKTGHNVHLAITRLAERIYQKVLRHELSVQEGWDGIKRGVFDIGSNRRQSISQSINHQVARSNNTITLPEAQPVDHPCC